MKTRKPLRADPEKVRAWQQRSRRPLSRKAFWKTAKGRTLIRKVALPKVNAKRQAKKHASYAKVLRSDFHKQLRYRAWERSGGLCECDMCSDIRTLTMSRNAVMADAAAIERAYTVIPIWFTKKGTEPWRRFRSTDGEVHHDSYAMFGDENPEELRLVRWTWDSCHQRIEREHGTRRAYLRGTTR